MLLPFVPPTYLPTPVGRVLTFVRESNQALKAIEEGEFEMRTTSKEGTVSVRMLVSAKLKGFRMIVTKDDETVQDVSFAGEQGVLVNHEARIVSPLLAKDLQGAATQKGVGEEIPAGNVSINLDSSQGLVLRANPGMENVRRWQSGGRELFTGDFGKGDDKRGTFQWERDVKSKVPIKFETAMDGNLVVIRFEIKRHRVSLTDLTIDKASYEGYGKAEPQASGTL